jgi:hypothetical protein
MGCAQPAQVDPIGSLARPDCQAYDPVTLPTTLPAGIAACASGQATLWSSLSEATCHYYRSWQLESIWRFEPERPQSGGSFAAPAPAEADQTFALRVEVYPVIVGEQQRRQAADRFIAAGALPNRPPSTLRLAPLVEQLAVGKPLSLVEPEPKRFDLSEFIAEVNAMKKAIPALNEEGPQRLPS